MASFGLESLLSEARFCVQLYLQQLSHNHNVPYFVSHSLLLHGSRLVDLRDVSLLISRQCLVVKKISTVPLYVPTRVEPKFQAFV